MIRSSASLASSAYSFLQRTVFAKGVNLTQSKQGKPLYVFNLHKSGSHFLKNILNQIRLQTFECIGPPNLDAARNLPSNGYLTTIHRIPCDDVRVACAKGNAKIILNIRDPRDIFLSTIDYFDWTRKPTAFDHVNFYREAYSNAFRDRAELAEAVLNDCTLGDYPYTLSNQLNSCIVLCHHPSVLTIRYEDLQAHSSPLISIEACHPIAKICRYLSIGIPADSGSIIFKAKNMGSRTMNVGQSGRWKTELDPMLLRAFEEKHGKAIELLGYSTS